MIILVYKDWIIENYHYDKEIDMIDFKDIIPHNGDQKYAFEELVSQLAYLEKKKDYKEYIRTGQGADGGAECYWVKESGKEVCWQAKFFINSLSDNEFSQIEKSVKSAIDKHPQIEEYIVCIPHNRADSRQKNTDGKPHNTEMAKWNKKVEDWKKLAEEKEMSVTFTYWGKTELLSKLIVDTSEIRGIKNYFFRTPTLNIDSLKGMANDSQISLGERYSEDDNIKLEIAESFNALSNSTSWKEVVKEKITIDSGLSFSNLDISAYPDLESINNNLIKWRTLCSKFDFESPTFDTNDFEILSSLHELVKNFRREKHSLIKKQIDLIKKWKQERNFHSFEAEDFGDLRSFYQAMVDSGFELLHESIQTDLLEEWMREGAPYVDKSYLEKKLSFLEPLDETFMRLCNKLSELSRFVRCSDFKIYLNKTLLLDGDAGAGKSHLLCDITQDNIAHNIPTVLLLGQHYTGGNPFDFLRSKLELTRYNDTELLSLLNVMGRIHKSRFTIFVDAINEGSARQEWKNHLVNFHTQIMKYPHIALAFSCMTRFKEFIIPENILEDNKIPVITHKGFGDLTDKAVIKYFSRRNLIPPSSPLLTTEFTNPLFLKTCCDALVKQGLSTFPKGTNSFINLFDFYLEAINKKVSDRIGSRPSQDIVFKFMEIFLNDLFPEHFYSGVASQRAEKIAQKIFPNGDLLTALVDEGLLSIDIIKENGRPEEIIRFTFEKYGEHFVARNIINRCETKNDIANLITNDVSIGEVLTKKKYEFEGLICALGLCVAEKFQCELIELIPTETIEKDKDFYIDTSFGDNILCRTPSGISTYSYELLKELDSWRVIKILLEVSIEPDHPWNINFVESKLIKLSMAERDSRWSILIAEEPKWNPDSSIIVKIFNWYYNFDFKKMDKKRVEILATLMLWLTSTSNRYVRDTATKTMSRIFFNCNELIVPFLKKYNDLNDLYIVERLYAAIFGATVYINESDILKQIAIEVYELQFKQNSPAVNIMIREYASLIIEYVNSRNLLPSIINIKKCRPPFKSTWPNDIPTVEELDSKEEITGLKLSLYLMGDFEKYTMRCVEDWSNTPIQQKDFISKKSMENQLLVELPEPYYSLYKKYLDLKQEIDLLENEYYHKGMMPPFYYSDEIWGADSDKAGSDLYKKWVKANQPLEKNLNDLWNELLNILPTDRKDELEQIENMTDSKAISFDKDLAVRFVHQKVYEFGWSSEYFHGFDSLYSHYAEAQEGIYIERIGKKYQWIALYELLARLSDNYKWIPQGFSDLEDNQYYSTIQISKRDIDPTMWLKDSSQDRNYKRKKSNAWWELPTFNFSLSLNMSSDEWLKNSQVLPDFSKLLTVEDMGNKDWTVLSGSSDYRQVISENNLCENMEERIWYRITAAIICKKDRGKFCSSLSDKHLENAYTFSIHEFTSKIYYGEFVWQPYFQRLESTMLDNLWREEGYDFPMHIPTFDYLWEGSANDKSLNDSIAPYMPSPVLVEAFQLQNSPIRYGTWTNSNDELIFLDPSLYEKGKSYALISRKHLEQWLDSNDLEVIWLIGGEKDTFRDESRKGRSELYDRYTFNLAFAKNGTEIEQIHFKDDKDFSRE